MDRKMFSSLSVPKWEVDSNPKTFNKRKVAGQLLQFIYYEIII